MDVCYTVKSKFNNTAPVIYVKKANVWFEYVKIL